MLSWNDVNEQLSRRRTPQGGIDFDGYRREQYSRLEEYTQRPVIIYAVDFLNRAKIAACGGDVEIDLSDRDGFLEVTRQIDSDHADVLIHSPGGLPEATDSIVHILRDKFRSLRFIVPSIAKSAATMLALSGDKILMEKNAELGPIDPQFRFIKGDGTPVVAPAQAIIDQFERAQEVLAQDPKKLAAWIPILQQYGPALYQQSRNAIELSKRYVEEWLKTWMFRRNPRRNDLARQVVEYLGNHNEFKTHGARVGVQELRSHGVKVEIINDDQELCERVLMVFYALQFTFGSTGAYKIFENSRGGALIRMVQVMSVRVPAQQGQAPQPPA